MTDPLEGIRLPDAVMGEPGPGWEAWEGQVLPRTTIAKPGSYMKVRTRRRHEEGPDTLALWCWYIVCPNGDVCTIRDSHQVDEHENGTITVSPSIVAPHGGCWHGWLKHGVWTSV
jgi:hypothetical protein